MLYLRSRLKDEVYLVEYATIKETVGDEASFRVAWESALKRASDQHGSLQLEIWSTVFERGGEAAGARPVDALRRYGAAEGDASLRRLVDRVVALRTAATANREALRKLVKKHDKAATKTLSHELLPKLYASSMASADAALEGVREALGARGGENDDEHDAPNKPLGYSESFVGAGVQETPRTPRGFRTLEASIWVEFQSIRLLRGPWIISARVLEIWTQQSLASTRTKSC